MTDQFDPYYEWLGIPPKDQPPNHYRLLGIELFEQNLNVIERAADRQMGHVRSFQSGRHVKQSQQLLNELAAAKGCLLNLQRKSDYDQQLQQKIATTSLPDLSLDTDAIPGLPPGIPDAIPVPLETKDVEAPSSPKIHVRRPAEKRERVVQAPKKSRSWKMFALAGSLILCGFAGIGFYFWQKGGDQAPAPPIASTDDVPTVPESNPVIAVPPDSPNPTVDPSPPTSTPAAPTFAVINEAATAVEDPASLAPSPAVPAAIEERILAAAGIRDDRFTFCQTLLWNQFAEINGVLRAQGYRLSRCRPYLVQGDWRVAAIWLRDGLPSRVVGLTDAATLLDADQRLRGQGFVPVDCVGVADGASELFGAVWVKPNSAVGDVALTLGVSATEYKVPKEEKLGQGYRPTVHLAYFDTTGARKYCNVWIKPAKPRGNFVWAGDQAFAVRQLAREAIQSDAMATPNPKGGVMYFGAQLLGSNDNIVSFVGLTPDALRNAAVEQAAAGNLPCSLSIASNEGGELLGVAIWRPANLPQTPFELAKIELPKERPTSPAPTPATSERALQLAGQGSVELQNTTGLANISRDFTVETWLRFSEQSYGTTNILFGTGAYRGLHPDVSTMMMKGWLVGIKPARADGTAKSQFILQWAESSGQTQSHTGDIPALDDQWHHLALCNRGASGAWEMVVYVDGQESMRASYSDAKDAPSPIGLYIGRPQYVAASRRALQGMIRGFRLSEGLRYQSNFQPEPQFKADDTTLALLDFSGTERASIADLSGKERHGKMNGVQWVDDQGNPVPNTSPLAGTAPTTEKRTPPTSIESELLKIREVFKNEIAAAKEPSALIALSEKLRTQAIEEQDPSIQFALFGEARRLAVEAADWNAADRVIDEQCMRFTTDPWALRAETFNGLSKKSKIASDRKILADTALAQAEAALSESAFEPVDSLLVSATNLAPRGERDLIKQVSELRKRLNDEKKVHQIVTDARATLAKSPDDPAANEVLGRYLCFNREDWESGIQHLTKGPEGKLTALARNDETRPTDPGDRMALAESWMEFSKASADTVTKGGAASRAMHWYQIALPDLTGVKKLQAEKQIEDLSKSAGSSKGKVKFAWLEGEPGVAMELRGHAADITCLAVARSGRFLVSGSQDDTVRIWDLATGKQVGQITPGVSDIYSLLLSPDDRTVAMPVTNSGNSSIGIWSLQNGQPIGSVTADGFSRKIAGSQDWRRVAYAKSQSGQGNLLVYNLTNLTPVAPLTCPGTPIRIAVSRGGRYLAAADENNVVHVLDMQTGKALLPLTGHMEDVRSLAFSPNERQLVSSSLRAVIVWDLAKGVEERRIIPANGVASAATFSPEGSRLLVSGLSSEIVVFSVKDGTQLARVRGPSRNGASSTTELITCFPDGRAAATVGYFDSVIRIWRLPQ